MNFLSTWNGSKTYLISAVMAVVGGALLYVGDGTLGMILLANGGGLAALRHAVSKVQTLLSDLQGKLDAQ